MADDPSSNSNNIPDPQNNNSLSNSDSTISTYSNPPNNVIVRNLLEQAIQVLETSSQQNNVEQITQRILQVFDVSNWIRWIVPLRLYLSNCMDQVFPLNYRQARARNPAINSQNAVRPQEREHMQRPMNHGQARNSVIDSQIAVRPQEREHVQKQKNLQTDQLQDQASRTSDSFQILSNFRDRHCLPAGDDASSPQNQISSSMGREDLDGYCMVILPLRSTRQIQEISENIRSNDTPRNQAANEPGATTEESREQSGETTSSPEVPGVNSNESKRFRSTSLHEPQKRRKIVTASANEAAEESNGERNEHETSPKTPKRKSTRRRRLISPSPQKQRKKRQVKQKSKPLTVTKRRQPARKEAPALVLSRPIRKK